jgi:hypothetical protein
MSNDNYPGMNGKTMVQLRGDFSCVDLIQGLLNIDNGLFILHLVLSYCMYLYFWLIYAYAHNSTIYHLTL